MTILVGSTNPVKINAVINACSETWPDVQVTGLSIPSGIGEQPMSDEETRRGARNRAHGLWQTSEAKSVADQSQLLTVGLEGGVFEFDGELWSTVWAVVEDAAGAVYESNGARFKVPDYIADHLRQGKEMGPLVAELVGEANLKHKQGMIGVITNNFIDRTEEYTIIAKMALGLWYGQTVIKNTV